MTLDELLTLLDECGVKKYGRNVEVAKKTGYATGMVAKVLSGHVALTDRFILAVRRAYAPDEIAPEQDADEETLMMIMQLLCSSLSSREKIDRLINMLDHGP